jgi:hypothetical protein
MRWCALHAGRWHVVHIHRVSYTRGGLIGGLVGELSLDGVDKSHLGGLLRLIAGPDARILVGLRNRHVVGTAFLLAVAIRLADDNLVEIKAAVVIIGSLGRKCSWAATME